MLPGGRSIVTTASGGTIRQPFAGPLIIQMPVSLKCAACGAQVEFGELSPTAEEVCPGCEVRVRKRPGDDLMAIPIAMNLPEEFQQADLSAVSNKSNTLVERYRKADAAPNAAPATDVVLAQALATLANSIQHLEERMDRNERSSGPEPPAEVGNGNGGAAPIVPPQAAVPSPVDEGVVQLHPDTADAKATPVGTQVLVRREAAREAHAFRREKHTQRDWDDRPDHPKGPTGFKWLMEHYPKSTFILSVLGVVTLAVMTTLVMQGFFDPVEEGESGLPPVETTALSELWADDPEAGNAEVMARGFLNAISAKAASPFVFESGRIAKKLERYFRPISSPEEYKLTLKSRAVAPEGESIFAYQVWVGNEVPRMLVVLPEGEMPKVFWEFFAEVGDHSWESFLKERPSEPALMRVWASQGNRYHESYPAKDWQCYELHDLAQKHKVLAYAERGTGPDWKIANALEKEPVKFQRHSAVMAQVKMTFRSEFEDSEGQRAYVAEIKEVPATSWLPQRFVHPDEDKK